MPHTDHVTRTHAHPPPMESVCPITPSDLKWRTIGLSAICWFCSPFQSWAQTSLPIPRTSATTEQQIREEVRYLQEETIIVVAHRDQLVVHTSVDTDVTKGKDIQNSGTANPPMRLPQEYSIGMVALSGQEFVTRMQAEPSKEGTSQPYSDALNDRPTIVTLRPPQRIRTMHIGGRDPFERRSRPWAGQREANLACRLSLYTFLAQFGSE